ncbi:MAG: ferric reductase-like transmembrane domain-containing protein [Ilumatobacteraceae bacterium]
MNDHLWWYLSRSTGIVALFLLAGSMIWGVLLSTRALREVDRPAWLNAMHTWLAGTGLVMTAVHVVSLIFDEWVAFGAGDILVPGVADWGGATTMNRVGTAIGVISLYVMVIVQATSYLRRHMSRRMWLAVHRLSYPLVFTVLAHAGWSGTDTSNRVYQVATLLLAMAIAAATVIRVITPARVRRAQV